MPKQFAKGDEVLVRGTVAKVWGNSQVTIHLHGYEYPVTMHEADLEEVIKRKPEPPQKPRRKPFYDKPT